MESEHDGDLQITQTSRIAHLPIFELCTRVFCPVSEGMIGEVSTDQVSVSSYMCIDPVNDAALY